MTKVRYTCTDAEGKRVTTSSYTEAQQSKDYAVQYEEGFDAEEELNAKR